MPIIPTRKDDEQLLDWLRLSKQGESSEVIASRFGASASAVRGTLCRVKAADIALSGEPKPVVVAGYR